MGGNKDPEIPEASDSDRGLHGLRQSRSTHNCSSTGGAGVRDGGRRGPGRYGRHMEQSQWTGRGIAEPQMSPSLQHMFALARRMGYEMRPIARRSGTTHQTPSSPRMTGQGYRAPFRQGCDYSKVKCFSCGQMGHTQARCPKPDHSLPFRPDGWNSQPDGPRQCPDGPQQGNDI